VKRKNKERSQAKKGSVKGSSETRQNIPSKEILANVEVVRKNHLTCLNFFYLFQTCSFLGLRTSWKLVISLVSRVPVVVEFPSYRVFLQCVI